MSTLTKSRYNPARGGHAPGDIREAFLEGLDEIHNGATAPIVEVRGEVMPFARLCGLLWNCRDQLPGSYTGTVQDIARDYDRAGFTYASAARAVKAVL